MFFYLVTLLSTCFSRGGDDDRVFSVKAAKVAEKTVESNHPIKLLSSTLSALDSNIFECMSLCEYVCE